MPYRAVFLSLILLTACNITGPHKGQIPSLPQEETPEPELDHTQVLRLFQDYCLSPDIDVPKLTKMAADFGLIPRFTNDPMSGDAFSASSAKTDAGTATQFSIGKNFLHHFTLPHTDTTGFPIRDLRCSIRAFVPPITELEKTNARQKIEGDFTTQSRSLKYQNRASGYQITEHDINIRSQFPQLVRGVKIPSATQQPRPEASHFLVMQPMEISLTVVLSRYK